MKIVWGEVRSLFSSVRSISFSLFPEFYKINMLWKNPWNYAEVKELIKEKNNNILLGLWLSEEICRVW